MGYRGVPDYCLQLVVRVVLCGMNGTRALVAKRTRKASATLARTMLQPILNDARLATKSCTRAPLNNQKANGKKKVRMECAATIHFMRNDGWEKVIDACLQHSRVGQHQIPRKSWEPLCKTWWENFASISAANLGRLRRHGTSMGTTRNELQWDKRLWTPLWMNRLFLFLQRSGK